VGTSWLSTELDAVMLGKTIQPSHCPTKDLPARTGAEVWDALNGRYLMRYVDYGSVHEAGREIETFVCPTPYAGEDLSEWLALPRPDLVRDYAVLIDPRGIAEIKGPRWCSSGGGIEYILPKGYPKEAIVSPGWAVRVR
jgi:hypothetical protein